MDPEDIDSLLALFCGYFLARRDEPAPHSLALPAGAPGLERRGDLGLARRSAAAGRDRGTRCARFGRSRGAAGIVLACVFGRLCALRLLVHRERAPTDSALTQPTRTTIEACPVANIKSQIKRNRQNDAAHERNKSVKSALKSAVRRFREAADAGDAEQAKTLAAAAGRKLDKAASKGVIHKNQAANKKSAINKRAASL